MSANDFGFEASGNRPIYEDRPACRGVVPAFDEFIDALKRTDPEWLDCIQVIVHDEMRGSITTDELHRFAREQLLVNDGYERLASFNKEQSRKTALCTFAAIALVASIASVTFIVLDSRSTDSSNQPKINSAQHLATPRPKLSDITSKLVTSESFKIK